MAVFHSSLTQAGPTRLAAAALVAAVFMPLNAQAQTPAARGTWRLGAAVFNSPEYPGSDKNKTRAAPLVQYRNGRFFVAPVAGSMSPLGVGYSLVEGSGWRLGAAFTTDFDDVRDEGDSPRLAGLGSVGASRRLGLFADWSSGVLALSGYVGHDVGSAELGTIASADLLARWQLTPRLRIGAGPGFTWGDRDFTQTLFGINAAQSAASGVPVHDAGRGAYLVRLTADVMYLIDERWSVGLRASSGRLLGDAADSPITLRRNQNTFGVFTSYGF